MLKLTLAILTLFVAGSIIIYKLWREFKDCHKELLQKDTRLRLSTPLTSVGPAASYRVPHRPPAPGFRIHRDSYLANAQLRNQIYKILEKSSKEEDYHISKLDSRQSKKEGFYLSV